MTYYQSPVVHIEYLEELNAPKLTWTGFAEGEQFREGLRKGLELLQTKKLNGWLADLRLMGVIDPDDEDWTNNEWFPIIIGAGLKNMALVPSNDVFNQMSVDSMISQIPETDLTVRYFASVEEAAEWLKSRK